MKIHVEMTEEEMRDYLDYQENKRNWKATKNRLHELAEMVLRTVGEHEGDYYITDIDDADELLEIAAVYLQ